MAKKSFSWVLLRWLCFYVRRIEPLSGTMTELRNGPLHEVLSYHHESDRIIINIIICNLSFKVYMCVINPKVFQTSFRHIPPLFLLLLNVWRELRIVWTAQYLDFFVFVCGLSRVVWATPEVRCCLWILLCQSKMGSETAAVKLRVKGLHMGAKMATPAQVNPGILRQATQVVIYECAIVCGKKSLTSGQTSLFCGIVLRPVNPMSKVSIHIWSKLLSFNQTTLDHCNNCRGSW